MSPRWLVLVLLALSTACGGAAGDRPVNVILITVDTHRGDHVLAERAGQPLTPRLERFARRAIWFPEAVSVSDCTSPGTAGILTGLWPRRSGVVSNNHTLSPRLDTLASVLRRSGLRTGAFVSNPVLRPGMGFESGFESYVQVRPGEGREDGEKRAKPAVSEVTREALGWLDGLAKDERFFLWVHLMEPHGPYRPPREVRDLFPKERFDAPANVPLLDDNSGRRGIPRYQQKGIPEEDVADAREYLARYAGEVRSLDDGLGEFLDALEERDVLESSVVVITSDHGEALADDGGYWFSHQNGTRRDQVHVPLLLYFPGCDGGARVEHPVSTVDVVPTVLARLGVTPPAELDGTDLVEGSRPWVLSETDGEIAVREDRWKLLRRKGDTRPLLIDVSSGEDGPDVASRHADVLERLSRRLQSVLRAPVLAEPVPRKSPGARHDDPEGS